jgi:hypothetical protein
LQGVGNTAGAESGVARELHHFAGSILHVNNIKCSRNHIQMKPCNILK